MMGTFRRWLDDHRVPQRSDHQVQFPGRRMIPLYLRFGGFGRGSRADVDAFYRDRRLSRSLRDGILRIRPETGPNS